MGCSFSFCLLADHRSLSILKHVELLASSAFAGNPRRGVESQTAQLHRLASSAFAGNPRRGVESQTAQLHRCRCA